MNYLLFPTKWMNLSLLIVMLGFFSACQSYNRLAPEKIIEQGGWYEHASWSPDGKSIIYRTGIDDQFEVFNLSTGNRQTVSLLPNLNEQVIGIEWIDEIHIMYITISKDGDNTISHLMMFDMVTNERKEFLSFQGNIYDFCWNRAANTPVVVGSEKSDKRNSLQYGFEVLVYDEQNENWTVVYEAALPNYSDGIGDISCHPYEDQIAFVEVEDDPGTHENEYNLYILSENYQTHQLILEKTEKGRFDSPTWSPDGQWIAVHAYSDRQGQRQGITIVPTDDTNSKQEKTIWLLFSGEIIWSPIDDVLLLRAGSSLGGYSLYHIDMSTFLNEMD